MMREFSTQSLLAAPRAMLGAAALATVLAASPPSEAGVSWGGTKSGLPWASGANGGLSELESYRGRKLDFRTMFLSQRNFPDMVRDAGYAEKLRREGSKVVVALGLMPKSHRGQHAPCGAGKFDTYIRGVGRALVNAGAPDAVLRLGWEANRVGGFAWAVTGDGSSYKACFRRWVSVLRSTPGQRFTIDWNMAQRGTFSLPVDRMYPGSDVVDIIGVQNYDRCAPVRTESDWDEKINAHTRNGSPGGIGTWLKYAKSKGKRLSMPEWGIGGPRYICRKPGVDNPFFIQKMHEWFRENASSIAYEAYFNGHGGSSARGGTHKLAPAGHNPKAAAAYRRLW